MFSKDFILNETQKLAQLIAKLAGVKAGGDMEQYIQMFNNELNDQFKLTLSDLQTFTAEEFSSKLSTEPYSAEKLNALALLLHQHVAPYQADNETLSTLKKILLIFEMLETDHHWQSMENIQRRKYIHQFFDNTHEVEKTLL
jgi:primase-polymerase (primpol)-like protein